MHGSFSQLKRGESIPLNKRELIQEAFKFASGVLVGKLTDKEDYFRKWEESNQRLSEGTEEIISKQAATQAQAQKRERGETIRSSKPSYAVKYQRAMEDALRNSPCRGCAAIALSGLVSHEIFLEMGKQGKSRENFSEKEVEEIKSRVEERYKEYL